MTEIIEAIDAWTLDRYAAYKTKLYGFSELIHVTAGEGSVEQIFPATYDNREKVTINDKYSFITWMRWQSPATYENNEQWNFGAEDARFAVLPLRLVLIHKSDLGEDLCFDFVNNLPSKLTVSGYKFVFVKPEFSVDPDHDAIIQQELGPANYLVYEKHRFKWNVYVINITCEFIACESLTP